MRKIILLALSLIIFAIPSSGFAGKFKNGNWKNGEKKDVSTPLQDARGNSLAEKSELKGTVSGKLVFQTEDGTEEPMSDCKVCFFDELEGPAPKHDSLWWRIPDHEYESLVDGEGNFNAEVPAGDYVIASVERLTPDEDFGPPHQGEKVYLSEKITIKENAHTKLGIGTSRKHTRDQQLPVNELSPEVTTAKIEGILKNTNGAPFKGGFVVAYPHGYLSQRTKADGKFTLYLPQGGEYSLVARNIYGFT